MRDGPNSPPLMARGEHPVVPPSARGTLTFQGRRRSQNRADQRTNALTFVPPGQSSMVPVVGASPHDVVFNRLGLGSPEPSRSRSKLFQFKGAAGGMRLRERRPQAEPVSHVALELARPLRRQNRLLGWVDLALRRTSSTSLPAAPPPQKLRRASLRPQSPSPCAPTTATAAPTPSCGRRRSRLALDAGLPLSPYQLLLPPLGKVRGATVGASPEHATRARWHRRQRAGGALPRGALTCRSTLEPGGQCLTCARGTRRAAE